MKFEEWSNLGQPYGGNNENALEERTLISRFGMEMCPEKALGQIYSTAEVVTILVWLSFGSRNFEEVQCNQTSQGGQYWLYDEGEYHVLSGVSGLLGLSRTSDALLGFQSDIFFSLQCGTKVGWQRAIRSGHFDRLCPCDTH